MSSLTPPRRWCIWNSHLLHLVTALSGPGPIVVNSEQPSHSCSAQSPPSSCGFRVLVVVVVVDFTVFCHHADLEVFIQLSESIAL